MLAASALSTKEKLLSIIDDIEIISKEIIENAVALKHQKISGAEQLRLTKLLLAKDIELCRVMKLAEEQGKIDKKMEILRNEVERHDQYIRQFEKQLKEAEQTLAVANYQAKQKLQCVDKAGKRPIMSEELIKYAHRISSSEAVCAPLNWQPGDPRRPYPTDIDMRLGLLTRYNDPPLNGHMISQQSNLTDIHRSGHLSGGDPPATITNQFSWHPSGDIHMSLSNQASVTIDTRHHKDADDVEVMSSDSSSSSSSDSQ